MRVILVNPSSNVAATACLRDVSGQLGSSNTEVASVCPSSGPTSVDSFADDAFSCPLVVEQVRKSEHLGFEGAVIASIHDTALDAARAAVSIPVVGMCEAGVRTALMLGKSFSVIVNVPRAVGRVEELVRRYLGGSSSSSSMCRSVRAVGVGGRAEDQIRIALAQDGAEVIVLGSIELCAQAQAFNSMFSAPCIDSVSAALKILEGLVSLGLKTSKIGQYAFPGSEFTAEVTPARSTRVVSVARSPTASPRRSRPVGGGGGGVIVGSSNINNSNNSNGMIISSSSTGGGGGELLSSSPRVVSSSSGGAVGFSTVSFSPIASRGGGEGDAVYSGRNSSGNNTSLSPQRATAGVTSPGRSIAPMVSSPSPSPSSSSSALQQQQRLQQQQQQRQTYYVTGKSSESTRHLDPQWVSAQQKQRSAARGAMWSDLDKPLEPGRRED